MKSNIVTTVAGIMAALGTVPVLIASSGAALPLWWINYHVAFVFILIGAMGLAVLGWASKGADEHSTVAQVENATVVKAVEDSTKK